MSLFFLEAFEHVYKARKDEYERMSMMADKKVKETEPGMLIHVQTKVSEDEKEIVYRWLEVYEKYEDFQVHFENPIVKEHIKKMNERKILRSPVEVIMYCDWTEKQKEQWKKIPGVNIKFASMVNGYFR